MYTCYKEGVILLHSALYIYIYIYNSLLTVSGPAVVSQPEEIDPFEFMDPVNMLVKMPKDFYEKIVSACTVHVQYMYSTCTVHVQYMHGMISCTLYLLYTCI